MISLPFRRSPRPANIDVLYGMIVAQARSPAFYRDYGVPDTVEGRLDMIVVHLMLVLRQMSQGQATMPEPGQNLFDRFCRDIDHNLREMGVSDLAVPKRMRRVAEDFYGRAEAYQKAIAEGDTLALEQAVARNVFGVERSSVGVRRLGAYMNEAVRQLANCTPDALLSGAFSFPQPEAVAAPARQET